MERYNTPLDADEFQQALFVDRFPVTYHDCQQVAKIIDEALAVDGFYTIEAMTNGAGHVVTAYNKAEEIIAHFVINRPVEAENRRIPAFTWLRLRFKEIGMDFKDPTIREMYKKIERHVRDGGTWDLTKSPGQLRFEFTMRKQIVALHTFFQEEIFVV